MSNSVLAGHPVYQMKDIVYGQLYTQFVFYGQHYLKYKNSITVVKTTKKHGTERVKKVAIQKWLAKSLYLVGKL